MKTLRFPSTLALLTLVLFLPGSAFAQTAPPKQAPAELDAPIIAWTNMARVQQGKAPLRTNEELTRAAVIHARNMANRETMAHEIDGDTLADRIRRVGYRHGGVGENVAVVGGYAYPAWALFEGWMRSEGHYRNVMNDQFTEIGVAVARSETGKYYACQVFGRPGAAPAYAPAPSPYTSVPMMPYTPYVVVPVMPYYQPGVAPYGYPTTQPQMMPYSPYTGAPVWLRPASRPPQPVDDMQWHGPWDWRH